MSAASSPTCSDCGCYLEDHDLMSGCQSCSWCETCTPPGEDGD